MLGRGWWREGLLKESQRCRSRVSWCGFSRRGFLERISRAGSIEWEERGLFGVREWCKWRFRSLGRIRLIIYRLVLWEYGLDLGGFDVQVPILIFGGGGGGGGVS